VSDSLGGAAVDISNRHFVEVVEACCRFVGGKNYDEEKASARIRFFKRRDDMR
jgi:hypothetical protein